jgi:hypothetical protein
MTLESVHAVLRDFLPLRSPPSRFTRSVVERVLQMDSAHIQAQASKEIRSSSHTNDIADCVRQCVAVYGHLFHTVRSLSEQAAADAARLQPWGVWDTYPKAMLPRGVEYGLVVLRGVVYEFPTLAKSLEYGVVPPNIHFRSAWLWFLQRYGHRAIYEGDIAAPRFADDIRATFVRVMEQNPIRRYDDEFSPIPRQSLITRATSRLLLPVWNRYERRLHDISGVRSDAMRRTHALRTELLRHAEKRVQGGFFDDVSQVWTMDAEELLR